MALRRCSLACCNRLRSGGRFASARSCAPSRPRAHVGLLDRALDDAYAGVGRRRVIPSGARTCSIRPSAGSTSARNGRAEPPRADSDGVAASRAVIVPSGLMEMLLWVGWNWIGPPSPSTRSPVAVTSSPVALICTAPLRVYARRAASARPGRRRRRSRDRADCRLAGRTGAELCQVARSCTNSGAGRCLEGARPCDRHQALVEHRAVGSRWCSGSRVVGDDLEPRCSAICRDSQLERGFHSACSLPNACPPSHAAPVGFAARYPKPRLTVTMQPRAKRQMRWINGLGKRTVGRPGKFSPVKPCTRNLSAPPGASQQSVNHSEPNVTPGSEARTVRFYGLRRLRADRQG